MFLTGAERKKDHFIKFNTCMHLPRENFMFHISGCYKSLRWTDFEEKKPYVIVRAPPVVQFLKKTFEDVVTLGPTAWVYVTIYFLQLIMTHGSIVVVEEWWESELVVDVTCGWPVSNDQLVVNDLCMVIQKHSFLAMERYETYTIWHDFVKGISFSCHTWGGLITLNPKP
jgi:hypothetical protein